MDQKPLPILPVIMGIVLLGAAGAIGWLLLKPDAGSGKTPDPKTKRGSGKTAVTPVERKEKLVTPEKFRKQGKTYAVKVVMNLHGRATHEDWGIQGVMSVNYLVTLRYDETVLVSEPKKLIVERHFLESRERLFTTIEDIDLSKDMKKAWKLLDYASIVEPRVGQTAKLMSKAGVKIKEKLMAESKRLNLNWSPILDKLGKNPGEILKTLSSKLEGRKVKLLWTEGGGVGIVSGADGLPDKEKRLLERAALLADGALFPNQNKRYGERWSVDATHFNSFLDVGLDGSLRGKVTLRRDQDKTIEGQKCATLKMLGGTISVVRDDATQEARGSLSPSGELYYDLQDDLITAADLKGKVSARFASKDHLLFKARFKGTPTFTVRYEAVLK
jgi:hypothetical protein